MSKEEKERQRRYQAEDDVRAMQRMMEIHKDPDRKKAMEEIMNEQMMGMKIFSSYKGMSKGNEK